MDIFKLLIKLLVTLLLIASFGCDSEDSPWNTSSNGQNNVCLDADGKPTVCSNIELGTITIKGKTPDGLPGTFYVDTDFCRGEPEKDAERPFVNVDSFELKTADIGIGKFFCVQLIRDKHLFVYYDWEIKDGDKNATFSFDWSAPNSWGLAPNGTYIRTSDGYDPEVKTEVKNEKIMISLGGVAFSTPVYKNKFEGVNDDGETLKGTISDDLSSISYHQVYPDGEIRNETLTLK